MNSVAAEHEYGFAPRAVATSRLIRIAHLADHRDKIPALTGWLYAEFNHLTPAQLMIQRGRRLAESAQKNGIPITFIALEGNKLVGSISLLPYSVSHRALTPLMADVFVTPDYRNRGIGAALVKHLLQYAETQGLEKVYLFTTDAEGYYARLGWRSFDMWIDRGRRYSIMSIHLPE